jgi:hypothetical protein
MKHNWHFIVPQQMKFQPRMEFLGGLGSFFKYTNEVKIISTQIQTKFF